MRNLLCVIIILFAISACSNANSNSEQDVSGPKIEELLNEVQKALVSVQSYPGVRKNLPQLDSVVLDLNGTFDKDGNLSANLFFVTAEGGVSQNETTKLTLTLKPPTTSNTPQNISASSISKQLSDLIKSAANGVSKAADKEPKLITSELKLSVSFGITKKGGAGVKFEIVPVGIEAGGKISATQIQSITLVFK